MTCEWTDDTAGCSLTQFCTAIDATTPQDRRTCRLSDWNNDEPGNNPSDCAVDRTTDSCIPATGVPLQQP